MTVLKAEHAAIVFVIVLLVAARYGRGGNGLARVEGALRSSMAPLVVGGLTACALGWIWGASGWVPIYTDEASYLLQAKLFATGRWTATPPPLPEFFEQAHVLLSPRVASKYPPGHALLLAPGVLLSVPALVPLVLSGIAASLMFLLAREVSNAWVAMSAWLLWFSTYGNLTYRPSFFSEVATSALWLAGWWAALRWHKSGRSVWLVMLATFVGWGAITRPLTMLAFGLPLAGVILWLVSRSCRWRMLCAPLVTVLAILTIIPLWNLRVTGDWRRTPLALYRQLYMPWDVLGFGLVGTAAIRPVPTDMAKVFGEFTVQHREHTLEDLPTIARERIRELREQLLGGWRYWLLPAGLVGLLALDAAGWVALACASSLFLAYLSYAHPPIWTIYYLELFPVPAFIVALGIWRISCVAAQKLSSRSPDTSAPLVRAQVGMLFLLPLFGGFAVIETVAGREWRYARSAHHRSFALEIARISDPQSVVFVRYSLQHYVHDSHVSNEADFKTSRVWLVHDRRQENAALRAIAADRAAYLYDESSRTLARCHGEGC